MVKRVIRSRHAWLAVILCVAVLSAVLPLWDTGTAQSNDGAVWSSPYVVGRVDDGSGRDLVKVIVPGTPPETKAAVAAVPEVHIAGTLNSLSSVPAFNWSYGCSATSAAMLFGYYDLHGYTDMYAGPTNGGACPMTNSVWGAGINGSSGECPLSATHMGKDGRAIKGHVDDYWVSAGSSSDDPYMAGGWPEHAPGECTGDFMGTSQSKYGCRDGATMFVFDGEGDPEYDWTADEPLERDGCHGLRLFAESRGYTVLTNFSQFIRGTGTDPNKGFTFANYQSEIDAGRPVLIHVVGHTMLGYGYSTTGNVNSVYGTPIVPPTTTPTPSPSPTPTANIVYLHDTWDYSDHQMTWAGTYSGLQHYGVSVIRLQAPPPPTPTPTPAPTPAPTVTGVSPSEAPAGSILKDVVITGTNFTGATAVSFGDGIAVEDFSVDSATQITADMKIDVCAGGPRDVSVTTPFGTGTLPDGFSIIAVPVPPLITSLDPGQGCQGQALNVAIHHTCLPGDILGIDFGAGIAVEGFTRDTTTQTTAAIAIEPAAGLGERDVSIITTGGNVTYPGGHFTVWPAGELTEVYILPVSQTVKPGQVFTVDVVVEPAVAIVYTHLNMCFDPSLVAASGVTEGNLLSQGGANTTFSPGTIDNVAGCISGVFGAITTPGGSVASPGVFATVTFAAITPETQGVSALDLSGVVVPDPTGQAVPLAVSDGNVTVEPCSDWDVNCDGCINVLDVILVGQHFGENGPGCWIREDVNCDGVISVLDIVPIGQHFGEGCQTPYKVGAVFAASGLNSAIGTPQKQTVEMLVEQINGAGGVNGHLLDVTIYDTGSDPAKCALLTDRLVNRDQVSAVIGPSGTAESLAVIDLVTAAQVPLVSCGAGKQIVEPVQERYWVFKTAPSEVQAVSEIVEYLGAVGIDKVALLTDASGFGTLGRNELLVQLPAAGIAIAANEVFWGCDVAAQLAVIAGTDAQAVICWASVEGTACVAQAMDGLGMTVPLVGSHVIATKHFIDLAGGAANGVVFPSGKLLIAEQLPEGDPQKALLLDYRQDFESLYGAGSANGFGGYAYDALMGMVEAMKGVGPDRAAIRAFLENNINGWAGISGVFDTSPSDHNGLSEGCMVMVQIVDGHWVWLE